MTGSHSANRAGAVVAQRLLPMPDSGLGSQLRFIDKVVDLNCLGCLRFSHRQSGAYCCTTEMRFHSANCAENRRSTGAVSTVVHVPVHAASSSSCQRGQLEVPQICSSTACGDLRLVAGFFFAALRPFSHLSRCSG